MIKININAVDIFVFVIAAMKKIVRREQLVTGTTQSCGCLGREEEIKRLETYKETDYVDDTCLHMIDKPKLRSNNTSGITGISWNKQAKKWFVKLAFQGVVHNLGYYDNIDDAIRVRKNAEKQYFEAYLKSRKDKGN